MTTRQTVPGRAAESPLVLHVWPAQLRWAGHAGTVPQPQHRRRSTVPDASGELGKTKTCTRCKEAKPETAFHRDGRNGRYTRCAPCRAEMRRGNRRDKQRLKTPERALREKLRRDYNITLEQFMTLNEAQGGVCAICSQPPAAGKRLAVDHCHASGVVRALLCTACNAAVGIFEIHHRAAADYLARYGQGTQILGPDAPRARLRPPRRHKAT